MWISLIMKVNTQVKTDIFPELKDIQAKLLTFAVSKYLYPRKPALMTFRHSGEHTPIFQQVPGGVKIYIYFQLTHYNRAAATKTGD